MSYILSPTPKFFANDDNGNPLAGGELWTFAAGTSTPLETYSDINGTANTNPIILDAGGRCDLWIDSGLSYKYVLKKADGSIVWTEDYINSSIAAILDVTVSTLADLKALSVSATSSIVVNMLGYYSAGDGGGGQFRWDGTSTVVQDDGMVVKSDGLANGRWLRIAPDGYINLRWYGALGDNSTDDTPAISAANAYAVAAGWYLLADGGMYVLESDPGMTVPIKLETGARLKWGSPAPYGLTVYPIINDDQMHFVTVGGAYAVLDKRIVEIQPEWFGAVGDGDFANNTPGTDNTTWLQTALNSANPGCTIVLDGTKKYWTGGLTWKAGVNLKSSQSRTNAVDGAVDYRANLQYNSATGTMIVLANGGTGGMKGSTIYDTVLDGFNGSGNIITAHASGMIVKNCTFQNCQGAAIALAGAGNSKSSVIENNLFTKCGYGVSASGNGCIDSHIVNNRFENCTNPIQVNQMAGWIIADNDISCSVIAIAALTDSTGAGSITGNNIVNTADAGKGIAVVASGNPAQVLIENNNLFSQSSVDTTGIATSGYFPGLIANNLAQGYAQNYGIDSTTLTQYSDPARHKHIYSIGNVEVTDNVTIDGTVLIGGTLDAIGNVMLGDRTFVTAVDRAAQVAIHQATHLGITTNDYERIISVAGVASETGNDTTSNVWDRKVLLRSTDGTGWATSVIHDGLGWDTTALTPHVDDRAWSERSLHGWTHWGDGTTTLMGLDQSNIPNCQGTISCLHVYTGLADGTVGLSNSLSTSPSSTVIATYEALNGICDLYIPALGVGVNFNVVRPDYGTTTTTNMHATAQLWPTALGSWSTTLDSAAYITTHDEYLFISTGNWDTLNSVATAPTSYYDWTSGTNPWAWGKIVSYIDEVLTVDIRYIVGTPPGGPSNFYINAAFPFLPAIRRASVILPIPNAATGSADLTPTGFYNITAIGKILANTQRFKIVVF